ncbi:MAG: hypothetical protein WAO14_16940, partial [Pseudolabrys sp.]
TIPPAVLARADEVIVEMRFAAVHESAFGTKRTWAIALQMSAIGVRADKFERRGISPATDRRCDVVVYAGFGEPTFASGN